MVNRINGQNPERPVLFIREVFLNEPEPAPADAYVPPAAAARPPGLEHYVIRYQGQELEVPHDGIVFHGNEYDLIGTRVIDIAGVPFFTHKSRAYYLLAAYPEGAEVTYENNGRLRRATTYAGLPLIMISEGKNVLTIDGRRVEFDVELPVAARGIYRLEAFKGASFNFRPVPEVESELFRIGRHIPAHGTGRSGFFNLFSIAVEGNIVAFNHRGVFPGGLTNSHTTYSPNSEAGPHGPFFVVLEGRFETSRPVPRENHRAYLLPTSEAKYLFMAGIKELRGLGVIDGETAALIINKAYTYEEFIDEVRDGRTKETVMNYAGLPPPEVLWNLWKDAFRAGAAFFKRIFQRGPVRISGLYDTREAVRYRQGRPGNVAAMPVRHVPQRVAFPVVFGRANFTVFPVRSSVFR